jgi:hypothetical protein
MNKNTVYFSQDDQEAMALFLIALLSNGGNFTQRNGNTPATYYAIELEK